MADCAEPIRLLPGPQGPTGTAGTDGDDGISSFTTLTAPFTMPAIGASGSATVASSAWAVIGEPVHLQNAGTLIVTAIPDATTLTLQNPSGYPANVAGGTIVALANKLGPSGFIGPSGAGGSAGTGISVTTVGDLQTHDGTVPTSLAKGTNGQVLHTDSATATDLRWGALDLTGVATALSGDLPVTEGGTGASTASAAATNLAVLPLTGGTLTGAVTVSHGTPEYKLTETGATADEGKWALRADGDVLKLQAVNDAEAVRTDILQVNRTGTTIDSVLASGSLWQIGTLGITGNMFLTQGGVVLANGANNNVNVGAFAFVTITGPTGAFSITGITNGSLGVLGRLLIIQQSVAFDMTIVNESASSTALNRIITSTGADVTLTGICVAKFIYSTLDSRWLLLGTQG